jgi:hypothetical protein
MHLEVPVAVAPFLKHQQHLSQSEPFAHNPLVYQTVSRHPAPSTTVGGLHRTVQVAQPMP